MDLTFHQFRLVCGSIAWIDMEAERMEEIAFKPSVVLVNETEMIEDSPYRPVNSYSNAPISINAIHARFIISIMAFYYLTDIWRCTIPADLSSNNSIETSLRMFVFFFPPVGTCTSVCVFWATRTYHRPARWYSWPCGTDSTAVTTSTFSSNSSPSTPRKRFVYIPAFQFINEILYGSNIWRLQTPGLQACILV